MSRHGDLERPAERGDFRLISLSSVHREFLPLSLFIGLGGREEPAVLLPFVARASREGFSGVGDTGRFSGFITVRVNEPVAVNLEGGRFEVCGG
jgi:hypothetical protein